MSISGVGAPNAELAIMLSKLRGAGETSHISEITQQQSAPLALSGRPEVATSTALSGTGTAPLSDSTLQYLTLMQADDGLSVAASTSGNFASSSVTDDLWALIDRWSMGSDTFSNVSENISIATQVQQAAGSEAAQTDDRTTDYSAEAISRREDLTATLAGYNSAPEGTINLGTLADLIA